MHDDLAKNLVECINQDRVDVLRSSLEQLAEHCNVQELLNRVLTDNGTLLHHAAKLNRVDCLRTLLTLDSDPTIVNEDGQTALDVAVQEPCLRAFNQCFLQAVAQERFDRASQLIASGLQVDMHDSPETRNTALHWAAMYSTPKMALYLVDVGFSLKAVNAMGDTALHLAIKRRDLDMVKCLIELGASWTVKNVHGLDCVDLAKDDKALLALCPTAIDPGPANRSLESQDDSSVVSEPSASLRSSDNLVSANGDECPSPGSQSAKLSLDASPTEKYEFVKPDQWYHLLWPRPKELYVSSGQRQPSSFAFGERKLRIYFFAHSTVRMVEMMSFWKQLSPLWKTVSVDLEFKHDVITGQRSHLEPSAVICGVFPDRFCRPSSYELLMSDRAVELVASDLCALGYGVHTLLQVVRLCRSPDDVSAGHHLPLVRIRDWPRSKIRALLLDMTGCRMYTSDTISQVVIRLAHLRASHLIIQFEVRLGQKFALPFDRQHLFDVSQVCQMLNVNFVPSLEVNSVEGSADDLSNAVGQFCANFASADTVLIGATLAQAIVQHIDSMSWLFSRFKTVLWSVSKCHCLAQCQVLPPSCILLLDIDQVASDDCLGTINGQQHAVCYTVRSRADGYFTQDIAALQSFTVRLASLSSQNNCVGVVLCDHSTGSEVVPHCMSYLSALAAVGIGWNEQTMSEMFSMLPTIAAEHLMNSAQMDQLFETVLHVAHLERCLSDNATTDGNVSSKGMPISVFNQILLNPNGLDLERYSPVVFKKARIELQRHLETLETMKRSIPYNFELALCIAEVQLVIEVMILGARLAQSLCAIGTKPVSSYGLSVVNPGVANLAATVRTDLANRLLKIRARFQHAWLSRNLVASLNDALKVFDNLFRDLLPPNLQAFGENLL